MTSSPIKSLLATLLICSIALQGCSLLGAKEEPFEKILRKLPETIHEVEVFALGSDKPTIEFTKNGVIESSKVAFVSAQINGKITGIHVEVGDLVRENEILVTLGESLSTDIIDAQSRAAQSALALSEQSKILTNNSGNQQINAAELSVELAQAAYQNAIQSKNNSKNTYNEQLKNAEIEVDNAKNNLKNAKSGYNSAQDTLSDLEDSLDDLQKDIRDLENKLDDNPETPGIKEQLVALEAAEKELKSAIKAAEPQVNSAKYTKDIADNRVDQAEINVQLLKDGFDTQSDQLDFAIQSAQSQIQLAQNQLKAAQTGKSAQLIQTESQIVQSQSSSKISRLNANQKEVRSPISGTITKILTEKGSFTGPGQQIIQIERTDDLIVKTSISSEEKRYIKNGQKVSVEVNGKKFEGKITEISPSLNQVTKKIDIEIELSGEKDLIPGVFAKIYMTPITKNIIFVPLNSLIVKEGKKYIRMIGSDEKMINQEVEIGEILGEFIEIKEGLKGNENIITTVTTFAKEGDKVIIASNE